MLLLTGPAGSGKTSYVLDAFRAALRAGNDAVRLLVPTATMAQHLQNEIAREGFVFRRGLIQTLSGFVESFAAGAPQASDAVLYLLTEDAVARVNRPEFRKVAHLPGFCARLARTIAEFSAAGCDSARIAACLPDAPLARAFLAVYEEVDCVLARRGLLLRAKRLELAARSIAANGLNGISTIWLDGFHALPDPELGFISALARHADVTVTLGDADPRLVERGFREQRLARKRTTPARALVKAARIEREADEIARRILEQATAGRPFREMAIVVRSEQIYGPLLRSTLERFRIPARFYFDEDAAHHPVTRFLAGAVDAMLGGWDHAAMLRVLRLAPRFAESSSLDRLDFAIREQIPNRGLEPVKALLRESDTALRQLVEGLAGLDEWRSLQLSAADWTARFRTLRNLFRPKIAEGVSELRSQAAMLDLLDGAFDEAAQALEPDLAMPVEPFWRAVKSVLRLKPLRLDDRRRDVVHVMSAHEARQWVLPVVFVCGLVEKQFPQAPAADPFFADPARSGLQAAGIRVRTAADFEREEQALFDSAISRATMLVTLSYPEFDARGESNLRSLYLESPGIPEQGAVGIRPAPRHQAPKPGPAVIGSPGLTAAFSEYTARVSASGLESYLQCRFQHFTRLLRLDTAPVRPEDRLDFLRQGEIVHAVLAEWWKEPQPMATLFERIFSDFSQKYHFPRSYQTERARNAMLADLERFAADTQWPRALFQSDAERKFEFALCDSITLKGRIDRIDTDSHGGAYIIDYKYSGVQRVKERRNGDQLQGPMYLLAAVHAFEAKPAGMFFVGVKGGVEYVGWSNEGLLGAEPLPAEWSAAGERVASIVEQIRRGNIAPAPADRSKCRYCDARDICRVETRVAIAEAEGT